MPEPDLAGDRDEAVRFGRSGVLVQADPQRASSTPENRSSADGISGDKQQRLLRTNRERSCPPYEAVLQPVRQLLRMRKAEAARELVHGQAAREFEQRQRITLRLGHDAVPDRRVEAAGNNRREEIAGVGQAADPQTRNTGQLIERNASRPGKPTLPSPPCTRATPGLPAMSSARDPANGFPTCCRPSRPIHRRT